MLGFSTEIILQKFYYFFIKNNELRLVDFGDQNLVMKFELNRSLDRVFEYCPIYISSNKLTYVVILKCMKYQFYA